MLESLDLTHFAVLGKEKINFSAGLNVILGENCTGKSLLLKLAYTGAFVSHSIGKSDRKTKDELQRALADKLKSTCMPDSLGRLVSRGQGRNRCEIQFRFLENSADPIDFSFATNSDKEVKLESDLPNVWLRSAPVFIPTKEIMSVYPNFASTLKERQLSFDSTYLDLAESLSVATLRRLPTHEQQLKESLEAVMQGKIVYENNRFYLVSEQDNKGKLEMPLVAEGIRKIALLAQLIMNGSLRKTSILFWDEPEVNFNPKLMRHLASILVDLTEKGVQIIMATHSLFLLREIKIMRFTRKIHSPANYIALAPGDNGVTLSQGGDLDDVDPVASLEAELEQGDRYMELP